MERELLLRQMAPCGLDCGRCVRYQEGTVARAARKLAESLEGFGQAAPRFAKGMPALERYPEFEAVLGLLAGADCPGCRQAPEKCFPVCAAKDCHSDQGVDFCAECDEFPCQRNQYPEMFKQRWQEINNRIKEIGAEAYYHEQLRKPRY
ncbi:MAG: DUF3795 domain-containing protein [candidate division FCPU426 bacterium]